MLTVRERTTFGFSAGGGRFQKENAAKPEIAVNKAEAFRLAGVFAEDREVNRSQL